MKQKYILIIIFFISVNTQYAKKNVNEVFSYSNELITKKYFASNESAGKIISSIQMNDEFLSADFIYDKPFFEFYINQTLVTSQSEIWKFLDYSKRQLNNGGIEFTINFTAIIGSLTGLNISLIQQFFPNSTLIREKLILWTDKDSEYSLNKLIDAIHFIFPINYFCAKTKSPLEITEIRIASWEDNPISFGDKSSGNHMFYPKVVSKEFSVDIQLNKGPINIISDGKQSLFTCYEHASQDNTNGMFDEVKKGKGNLIVDAMQGTKGVFNFEIHDQDFWFLGIENKQYDSVFTSSVKALRGAYIDGELINKSKSYESVWTANAFYDGNSIEKGKKILRHYLLDQICENRISRKPEFYYNTWGLQRNDPNKPLRGILTYDRIFKEIEYAAQLGVDIFVLDDGWEQAQGNWVPHSERLPKGLEPIKKKLDEHGLKMGLWFSPMGIDSTTERYKKYPNWVIKDSEDNPILAQWGHPAFDFVSDFFYLFIEDCKKLIDQGCRFMKWDAINTFYSDLPNLQHGDSAVSAKERRARYEYLLPIYVTKAMEILNKYEPELVIEIDLTEARRVMTGLAPLSQGKLFWMNNGASTYNDYSTFRTKSMRTIPNEFAGIIPWELFTYANYPHNIEGAMKYNVHNSLLAGHGFWGNLDLMNEAERKQVGKWVNQSKSVLSELVNVNPEVVGQVGDSPEIYSIINQEKGIGQIIGFSEDPINYEFNTQIVTENVLSVLNNPFKIESDIMCIDFSFNSPRSSIAAYVIPNNQFGITIISSDVPIESAENKSKSLIYHIRGKGKQQIRSEKERGYPQIIAFPMAQFKIIETNNYYEIQIWNSVENQTIEIKL